MVPGTFASSDGPQGVGMPGDFMNALRISGLLATAGLALLGCVTRPTPPPEWTAWQAKRLESVGGTNGWTTLVGLHWLAEGPNSAGTAATNQIAFDTPHLPPAFGTFIREGLRVKFLAAPGADVRVSGQSVTALELITDAEEKPTRLESGTASVVVIQRGDRLGLRVRDSRSPARRAFRGLKRFPYDPAWRLTGRFEPFSEPRTLRVPNVVGLTEEFASPGALVFVVAGQTHRLDVALERGETDYFVMFHDRTAGDTTYGAGRFLYVQPPGPDGTVTIDFNLAYTPPCGFTRFATCPLPPRQNRLPVAIPAGELKPANHP
jgi:uncharacterized protein (DUF1684 family)